METLLLNEDFDEAAKLIDFALTIKGINKMAILLKKVQWLERQADIKGALKLLKEVKLASIANDFYEIDEVEKRLKAKKDLLNSKEKSKAKKGT